jgi:hypothetical protein
MDHSQENERTSSDAQERALTRDLHGRLRSVSGDAPQAMPDREQQAIPRCGQAVPQDALRAVSDDELLRRLGELVRQSRRVEADLVAHIGEVEERKLFARFAFSSMYAYCTEALHLTEAEAYRRITVARAARKDPALLELLRDGRLHLTGLALLVPRLTPANRDDVLRRATHCSKREIEELVAELAPRPDVPARLRKLPERRDRRARPAADPLPSGAASGQTSPAQPPSSLERPLSSSQLFPGRVVQPLSPSRYKVQFTASAELKVKLERLGALMRCEVPDGDIARVIERAVTEKLERLEARRFAQTDAPRKSVAQSDPAPRSRAIPAAVRRAVWARDEGRCRFVDELGRRCSERHWLEFHHRYPYGMGGDHGLSNVMLLCARHNRHLAERDYGKSGAREGLLAGRGIR